ncbi:MAG: type II secretion system protein [Thermoanaerobaculia bacterium]
MFPSRPSDRRGERGFTLAAVLVILTVLAVVLAYSVPPLWSQIMGRERDRQTIFVMKQYARAIHEFQKKRGAPPSSLEILAEQKEPRVLRQLYVNPLSGKMDWIMIPAGSVTMRPVTLPGAQPGGPSTSTADDAQPGQKPELPGVKGDPMQFKGPFIGVRPPQTGNSYLALNEATTYETWIYTTNELQQDLNAAQGLAPNQPGIPRR